MLLKPHIPIQFDQSNIILEIRGRISRMHLLPLHGILLVRQLLILIPHVPLTQPYPDIAIRSSANNTTQYFAISKQHNTHVATQ